MKTSFDVSDVIFASPLGLRKVIESERNADFLAGIEIMVVDSCELLLQQNWAHLEFIFENTNLLPKEIGDADISRLQPHALNGFSKYLRQTIFLSEFTTPEINSAFFRRFCHNPEKVFFRIQYEGVLDMVDGEGKLKYGFQKTPFKSVKESVDDRFHYFTREILPKFREKNSNGGILIVALTYFVYVRLRNHLDERHIDLAHICEHTQPKEVQIDKADFLKKNAEILIVTERYHFYHRERFFGVEHIIFYAPLTNMRFYPEFVQMIHRKNYRKAQILTLYNEIDKLAMERIVGTLRCETMLSSDKNTHLFLV